jgi:UDPglucose 6-dehydrogenase
MGAVVRAFHPAGMEQAKTVLPDVIYCDGPYSCADGADGLVIVTEWEQFRALDLDRIKQHMACPVLVDLRNIYSSDEIERCGFLYVGIGKTAPRLTMRL